MSPPITYSPLTLAALRRLEIPPRKDLVEGLLPEGQVTLFTAREKSGKTLIATDLACAIALEQPFLDRAVRAGTVVFIPLEENIREVRHRILERIGKGYDDASIPLLVLPANGYSDTVFRLDNAACMTAFTTLITEHAVDVVIIDTMREAHGLRENESDDMAALIRPLRQIAHATNCAIILIHQSKSGNSRGSTAIAAGADQLWTFERTDRATEGATANLTGTLRAEGRFGPPVTLTLRLGEGLRWMAVSQAATVLELSSRERILAILEGESDGMTAPEIAKRTGIHLKTVQNEIARMLNEHPAPPVVASGRPTRGNPRRYLLATPTLFPKKQTGTIVPTAETQGGEDLGTSPSDHSHGSRNDRNDDQPSVQPIVPDSPAPREAGVGNDLPNHEVDDGSTPKEVTARPSFQPLSIDPTGPYVEVLF